jgi:CBS domain-containing protein
MRALSDIICNQNPLVMSEGDTVKAACTRMREKRAGSVLVTDAQDRLIGIFTGRDAVCRVVAAGKSPARTRLGEVMTGNPVTMAADKTAVDALRLMWDGGFRHVPIVADGKIAGVVSRGDFKGDEQMRLDDERELWEHMR